MDDLNASEILLGGNSYVSENLANMLKTSSPKN